MSDNGSSRDTTIHEGGYGSPMVEDEIPGSKATNPATPDSAAQGDAEDADDAGPGRA